MLSFIKYSLIVALSFLAWHSSAQEQIINYSPEMYILHINSTKDDSLWLSFDSPIVYKDEKGDTKYSTIDYNDLNEVITKLMNDLYSLPKDKNDVLLYIHGMRGSTDKTYEEVVWQLKDAYINPLDSKIGRIVSIWWPANDFVYAENIRMSKVIKEQATELMMDFVRRFQIANLYNDREDCNMNLMCHSLGNYLIEQVVSAISEEDKTYPLFNESILTAPDIDFYALEGDSPIVDLCNLSNRVHIYFNNYDVPLMVSQQLHDKKRLGTHGISKLTRLPDNTYLIDATDISDHEGISDKLIRHSYHRSSPQVGRDMLDVLNGVDVSKIQSREKDKRKNHFILKSFNN